MPPKPNEIAVTEFALALGALVRRMRAMAPSETQELSWTQKAVLKRLAKEGAATTAELARAEGVKPQSMGTAIATLEELGLVERKPHPTDGRQINVQVTAKGQSVWKAAHDVRHTWLAQAVAKLSKPEQATLFAAGEIVKKLTEL